MATQVASLYGLLTLDDGDFSRKLNQANTGLAGLGESLKGLGQKMMLVTAPIAGAFGVGIKQAAGFESVMTEIGARAGLTADEIARVSEYSLAMGADTMFSGQQAAEAFLQLLTSGQSVEEAFITLPAVLDAAAASGADLGTTADAITDIMAAMGVETEYAADVVDTLARASGSSSATMTDLFAGFANVGGVARSFGLSVNDAAAALAVLSENGIKGAEGGTALKSMLLNMQRQTDATKSAWNALGTSFFDANGNARDLAVVIEDIKVGLENFTPEEQTRLMQDLAGSYGIVALTALTGSVSIDDMAESMRNAASASEVAQANMGTFNGVTNSLMGSIETLMITALTPFMNEVLKPLAIELTKIINSVIEWATANPALTAAIVGFGAALVVLGPVLYGAGIAIGAIGAAIGLLLSPIGLAIVAAGLLALAYFTNFGGIRDFIDTNVRPVLDSFFGFLGAVWEQVSPALIALFDWFTATGLPLALSFVTDVVLPGIQSFIDLLGGIWAAVQPALSALQGGFETVFGALQGVVQGVLDIILAIPGAVSAASSAITGGLGVYGNLPTQEVAAGLSQMNPGDALGMIWGAVSAEFGGGRADGGPVDGGTPYMVGERGPELFVPNSSGTIIPHEAMGGVQIGNVTIYANDAAGGRAAAQSFEAQLVALRRQRG